MNAARAHPGNSSSSLIWDLAQIDSDTCSTLYVPSQGRAVIAGQPLDTQSGAMIDVDTDGSIRVKSKPKERAHFPIRVVHAADDGAVSLDSRTSIIATPSSDLIVIEEFHGTHAGTKKVRSKIALHAQKGSKLTYFQLIHWGSETQYSFDQTFNADADAEINVISIILGGQEGHISSHSTCAGPGAKIQMSGAAKGAQNQKITFTVTTRHPVPETKSGFDFYTVMGDRSKAIFNGMIVITPEGRGTDAYQKNRNMLLSPQASVETFPQLEIATDEVKCAHGASIAPVNDEQLYYLTSRGISPSDAELMIIDGFTSPILSLLPDTAQLKSRVSEMIALRHLAGEPL